MISFHTDTIVVLRAPLVDDPDYGNQVPDWPNATETTVTGCRVQPERGSDYTIDREAVLTRWRLFAPPTIDLLATDRVRHDGVDYDVEGSVERWPSPTNALAHVEARLRRVDG
jgi:hypothetical protein